MEYVIGLLFTGLIVALPTTAVGLLAGWRWGLVVWLVLMFLNIMSLVTKESKKRA